MPVVTCGCGQSVEVDAGSEGKLALCSRCGRVVELSQSPGLPPGGVQAGQVTGQLAATPDRPRPALATPPTPGGTSAHVPYTILRQHGKGGMGRVSVARDEPLKREVALKELLDSVADDPVSRHRFTEEAEITGQLEHPGVVPVYALGVDRRGRPFYAMRLVRGHTLRTAIEQYHQRRTPLGLRALLRRFVMVCETMAYAHARGIIHRDLKPTNVILGEFGETLVLDWGLAKPVAGGSSPESTRGDLAEQHGSGRPELTEPGRIMGTPAYMSPEQASGHTADLTPASDIYSLGAILYHLLTGRPAHRGSTSAEVIEKVRTAQPAPPSTVVPAVPRALEAICLKTMARQTEERYPTARALAQDVQNWLDDEPVSAFAEPRLERVFRWSRKHKAAVVGSVAFLVGVILVAAVAAVLIERQRARAVAAEELSLDYARQAEEAGQLRQEKEQEAQRLADQIVSTRAEAAEAVENAARASQEAAEAKPRIAQLETEMKVKSDQAQEFQKKIDSAREALAAAEVMASTETGRARAAFERVQSLEQQVASLRREAEELRALASRLSQLAASLGKSPQPMGILAGAPWDDCTEQPADSFDVAASNNASCTLASDSSRTLAGSQSLRLEASAAAEVCLTYPKRRAANWDLSRQDYLSVAFLVDDPKATFKDGATIRIGRGSSFIQYQGPPGALNAAPTNWPRLMVPLAGDTVWKRSDTGELDLAHVDWLEIRVAPEKPGCRLWLDDLRFGPDPLEPSTRWAIDPDRRGAQWALGAKGTVRIWASGKESEVKTLAELPKGPFKLLSVNLVDSSLVRDDMLRSLNGALDCHSIDLRGTAVGDSGLEHLRGVGNLEWLDLSSTRVTAPGCRQLEACAKLKHLALIHCNITDEGLEHLKGLALESLDLTNYAPTGVSGAGFQEPGRLKNLKVLILSCGPVTDESLQHLKSLSNLEDLRVHLTAISGSGFKELESLGKLQALHISNTQLNDEGMKYIARLPALVFLQMHSSTRITDKGLRELATARKLQHLYLSGGEITDDCMAPISKLPALRYLYLQGTGVTDAGLEHLRTLHGLADLNLEGTKVTAAGVARLKAAFPNCGVGVNPEVQKALDAMQKKRE